MANTLRIYKAGLNKFWHTSNGDDSQKYAISDFEVSIDGNNFNIIQNDGAARLTYDIHDVTIQVETGPIETFSTSESLYNRLIEIAYTPFAGISGSGGLTYSPEDVANKVNTLIGNEGNTNEYPNVPAVVAGDMATLASANAHSDAGLALKLDASAYNDRFKGKYTSLSGLNTAHPTSNDGDYAIVDAGLGSNAQEYIWDAQEGWVLGTNIGASTTDALAEGSTNLYFKTARVLATVLSGLSTTVGGPIVSTDSILQAFGKLQKQISDFSTIGWMPAMSTSLIDTDFIVVGDSSDSNKTKTRTFAQLKATLKTYFDTLYQSVLVSGTNIKTVGGVSVLGAGDIPVQITITTSTSITNATNDASGNTQNGKNIIIDNGTNVINYTINGALTASFVKLGTGAITFVQGSGRTLVQVDGTAVFNGAVGSTATITSVGTTDYLRIANA